jgi:hypothetical protein
MYFARLSMAEQYELLSRKGRLVKTLTLEKRKVNLYIMDDRYFELRYDEAGNLIEIIREITAGHFFKIYLL